MRIIKKKPKKGKKPENFIPVSEDIDDNIQTLDHILQDCTDIVKREFRVGVDQTQRMYLAYVDGMADTALIHDHILRPLVSEARLIAPDPGKVKRKVFELISEGALSASDIKEGDNLDEAVLAVLSGDTILLMDGMPQFLVISTKGWPLRSMSEPTSEMVIRGPRRGFIETFRVNTMLLRREIRDAKLKIEALQLGERTKTDVGIAYIEDIVNNTVLEEVKKRLDTIDIDGVLESGYVEQLIEDNWFSFFPQIQYTERPDKAAAAILEGKVVLIIDNTPMALIIPATLNDFIQSPEDYYDRWWVGTFIRWIRIGAILISFVLPAAYIAVASYHPGIIPGELVIFMAGTREKVPFPVFLEAFIMEITFELLREGGIRLPGQIGATIGIVGSLIIGQAAVEAGLVSPIMVIIVAITAISSFAIPGYNLSISFRLLRFLAMIAASILGLYGLILVVILTLVHLSTLNSFGIPYLFPFVSTRSSDWKDSIVKAPILLMKSRPQDAGEDRKRMDDLRIDKEEGVDIFDSISEKNPKDLQAREEVVPRFKKPKKLGKSKDKDRGGDENEQ